MKERKVDQEDDTDQFGNTQAQADNVGKGRNIY